MLRIIALVALVVLGYYYFEGKGGGKRTWIGVAGFLFLFLFLAKLKIPSAFSYVLLAIVALMVLPKIFKR